MINDHVHVKPHKLLLLVFFLLIKITILVTDFQIDGTLAERPAGLNVFFKAANH